MAPGQAAHEAAIREQAYYFWEQDGRPEGRETEYWQRASVAVTEKAQLDTLSKAPPKPKAKSAAPKVKVKAVSKLKAAASAVKAAPAKASKAAPKGKPKKK
jgi:Protein of unknown function (DUF2934)